MYIVIELQTSSDGTVGNFVWAFRDLNEAESKYHAVLSAAAISSVPVHSACLLSNDGACRASQSYTHE